MKFRNYIVIALQIIVLQSLFSQNIDGNYENPNKIISFTTNEDGSIEAEIVLKTFYGFYYDGIYTDYKNNSVNVVIINNNIYTEYWEKGIAYSTMGVDPNYSEPIVYNFKTSVEKLPLFHLPTAEIANGTLWLPQSNCTEITLDDSVYKDEVIGFYIDNNATYKIRYWICDMPYTEEKSELRLIANSEDEELKSVFIDKYIQIGDRVYTCTTGLRSTIRNVTTIDSFENISIKNSDNSILAFGEPYLVLSEIQDIEGAIDEHNSIDRPPRDGRAKFVEPSIYKKLEEMTIDQL